MTYKKHPINKKISLSKMLIRGPALEIIDQEETVKLNPIGMSTLSNT